MQSCWCASQSCVVDSVDFGLGGDLVLGERAANCGGKNVGAATYISHKLHATEYEEYHDIFADSGEGQFVI